MRLLMFGDMAPTGFGTVTQDLGRELLAVGVDVRFVSQNELGDVPEPFGSRTFVVNEDRDGWMRAASEGRLKLSHLLTGQAWADGWTPETVLILGDFYAARALVFLDDEAEAAFRAIPTYHYCPIEGIGLPPSLRRLWQIIRPIAMSDFGAREIARLTGSLPPVVYHGVDASAFWPVSAAKPIRLGDAVLRSKADCRARFKIPAGMRVVLRTDKNVQRKQYAGMLRGMAEVMGTRPDVLMLWHCSSVGMEDTVGDLRDLVWHYPTEIRRRMCSTGFHDHGYFLSRAELNALYNAADLYVSTSSEGFGLTIAEALACGVPAVGLDFSAVPEVIGPAGRLAKVGGYIDAYAHLWATVDHRDFGRVVGDLLDDPREMALLGAKGPHHVASSFSWPAAAVQIVGIVERVEVAA